MATSAVTESQESLTSSIDPISVLIDAINIVNQRIDGNIIFLGQPDHTSGAHFNVSNLCELAFEDGKSIGDVNIVVDRQGVYNYAKKNGLLSGFILPKSLLMSLRKWF